MGILHEYPDAADQPYGGQERHKQHTAPYGRLEESQVHQARYEIARPVLVGCEVVVNAEPISLVTIPAERENYWVTHLLISVAMPVMRFIGLRCVHRPSCGRRPVVASAESGSATSIPEISRPPESALTATRASWSAVAAPADTPSSVAAVRIAPGSCGLRPSTNTARAASRWPPVSPSRSALTLPSRCPSGPRTCRLLGLFGGAGGVAHAVGSEPVIVAYCWGMVRAVGIP